MPQIWHYMSFVEMCIIISGLKLDVNIIDANKNLFHVAASI